ncbi:4-hydroxy-tetrahydrodipicolinate synthase [Roseomonas elaeocarpi]|uniref:4-hydroxy-tetrahydrodipicolinate synthase n=1 Tax=Roseomonas elaeocarpi TaxID=907779 RepID=A0ABV6JUG5_9PROT
MTRQNFTIQGVIPALVTPFGSDDEVDEAALYRLATRAVRRGVAGLVVCGSTGEAAAMSAEEQARAIDTVVQAAGGRVPVIAGIGAPCTRGAAVLARSAERCGAAALLVASPPYVRPGQDGVQAHLRAVAASSGLPLILYDVPSRVGVGIADETVARLRSDGVIAAFKDASGDLARVPRLRALCGGDFPQLSGDDATALAHLAMGGVGCISVTANLVPELLVAQHEAWTRGEFRAAAALRDRLAPLHDALFAESNPVPVKAALALLGLCDATPRLPLTRASRATEGRLAALLRDNFPEVEEVRATRPSLVA